MNARILGDWLVWEKEGAICTLDTTIISSTYYCAPDGPQSAGIEIYCRDESRPAVVLYEDDATWFHTWWLRSLEEEEKVMAEWREEDRKLREKRAKEEPCPTQP